MKKEFEQISIQPGFMKHNGGLLFKTISENEYEFKTTIKENHLNAAGITHGGFISAVVDAGAGTASDWETTQFGVSFALNDNTSISYGQRTIEHGNSTKVDETTSGVAVSYTMGSMSVTANMNTADDYKGTAASEKETTEIAVSFAF